jgi:uncharacterized cupin superfamily protein
MDRRLTPAFKAMDVPARTGSGYPEPFRSQVAGREKRALGEVAGLANFGVNLVRLPPGSPSSMRHFHSREDEFVYVLEGEVVLQTDAGEQVLTAGMCAGFPAGVADGHRLVNRSNAVVVYLEVGDRHMGDAVEYPDIDLRGEAKRAGFVFTRNDGTPY